MAICQQFCQQPTWDFNLIFDKALNSILPDVDYWQRKIFVDSLQI